jgi:integrase
VKRRNRNTISSVGRLKDRSVGPVVWTRIGSLISLKAAETRRTYRSILREWCAFLGGAPGEEAVAVAIVHATEVHAAGYRLWLESRSGEVPRSLKESPVESRNRDNLPVPRGESSAEHHRLAEATIHKKFAALRRMYRSLISANIGISRNPFDPDAIPVPPKYSGMKRPTEMVPYDYVPRILEQPDKTTPKGIRDHALLSILFGAALRRSEIIKLRLGDIKKTKAGTTFLQLRNTKAKRDAEQALPSWAAEALALLLDQRAKEGASSSDFLFISYRGRGGSTPTTFQLSDNGLYRIFKQYAKQAGVPAVVTPHSARATAITRLLDQGIPHREVQEFSRHSSIQMVEAYDKRRYSTDQNPARVLDYVDPPSDPDTKGIRIRGGRANENK